MRKGTAATVGDSGAPRQPPYNTSQLERTPAPPLPLFIRHPRIQSTAEPLLRAGSAPSKAGCPGPSELTALWSVVSPPATDPKGGWQTSHSEAEEVTGPYSSMGASEKDAVKVIIRPRIWPSVWGVVESGGGMSSGWRPLQGTVGQRRPERQDMGPTTAPDPCRLPLRHPCTWRTSKVSRGPFIHGASGRHRPQRLSAGGLLSRWPA